MKASRNQWESFSFRNFEAKIKIEIDNNTFADESPLKGDGEILFINGDEIEGLLTNS